MVLRWIEKELLERMEMMVVIELGLSLKNEIKLIKESMSDKY